MENNEKVQQLQMFEQHIQTLLMQKQQFQQQLMEVDSALNELDKSKGQNYKIIGAVMIAAEKEDLKKDLEEKKELIELRIKTVEKQENKLKEKAESLQSEVLTEIKAKEGK